MWAGVPIVSTPRGFAISIAPNLVVCGSPQHTLVMGICSIRWSSLERLHPTRNHSFCQCAAFPALEKPCIAAFGNVRFAKQSFRGSSHRAAQAWLLRPLLHPRLFPSHPQDPYLGRQEDEVGGRRNLHANDSYGTENLDANGTPTLMGKGISADNISGINVCFSKSSEMRKKLARPSRRF